MQGYVNAVVSVSGLRGLPFLHGWFISQLLQKLQAVCTDMAGFDSSFDGAAGLLAVAAVVEPALADEAAHIGEIVGQGGYLKMV